MTLQDMHDILIRHFSKKVGLKRVIEKRYCLARLNGKLVRAEDWNDLERMGELVMSMVVEREWSGALAGMKICPKCGKTDAGIFEDHGWLVWCVANLILMRGEKDHNGH
jgi:hypothetical protein